MTANGNSSGLVRPNLVVRWLPPRAGPLGPLLVGRGFRNWNLGRYRRVSVRRYATERVVPRSPDTGRIIGSKPAATRRRPAETQAIYHQRNIALEKLERKSAAGHGLGRSLSKAKAASSSANLFPVTRKGGLSAHKSAPASTSNQVPEYRRVSSRLKLRFPRPPRSNP